ncbi:hypothetical protein RchiOBHm_Chr3g0493711 [Rosa chinensis]|uniref:Uncharacterized protein n=1 Tax=Rosa chinensis TaxID=74649 RepID=A0A2P6RGU4_ROSCH|nr:hypothetical protein RchiOBHm_Chr3g0493711 [Rosa chinensis]
MREPPSPIKGDSSHNSTHPITSLVILLGRKVRHTSAHSSGRSFPLRRETNHYTSRVTLSLYLSLKLTRDPTDPNVNIDAICGKPTHKGFVTYHEL